MPNSSQPTPALFTRFEQSIRRYDEDEVIAGVLTIAGFMPPSLSVARQVATELLTVGGRFDAITPPILLAQRDRISNLLALLDMPKVEPTADQVRDSKTLTKTLCVASKVTQTAIEIHAGIGAVFYRMKPDTLVFELAPCTGKGMDKRREYLVSVIEASRDVMEQLFS